MGTQPSGPPIQPFPPQNPPPQPALATDGLTPLTPDELQAAEESALHEGYVHRFLKGVLDEPVNVALGGNLGQSLSSRIGLDAAKGERGAIILAHLLGIAFHNPEHAVDAEAADLAQAEKVVQVEEASPDLPKEE